MLVIGSVFSQVFKSVIGEWILAKGSWYDGGQWDDTATWND